MNLPHVIFYYLSLKRTVHITLICAIALRALQVIYFFNTRNDMTFQILAAQNLYYGDGLTISKINPNDLSDVIYNPMIEWPPGFSLLFIPFYFFFCENYLGAALCLSILFSSILIFSTYSILKSFAVSNFYISLFLVLTGFHLYYFYLKPCTDAVAISCLMVSIYVAFNQVKAKSASSWKTLFVSFLLLLSASIKYMYVPIIFCFPLLYFLWGYNRRRTELMTQAMILLVVISTFLFLFFIDQKHSTGSIGYIKEDTRGLFFDNLKAFHPFLITSFIKPESVFILSRQILALPVLYKLFQIFQLIFLFAIALAIFKYKKFLFAHLNWRLVLILFFLITFCLCGLLVFLSVFVGPEALDNNEYWTYVEEPRYFGLIQVFVHVIFFVLISRQAFSSFKCFKVVKTVGLIFLFLEMFRGVFFSYNRIIEINTEEYGWQSEMKFQNCVNSTIAITNYKETKALTILVGSSDWMTLRAALKTRLPILDSVAMLSTSSKLITSKPVKLIAVIRNEHCSQFYNFINSPATIQLNTCYGFTIYSHLVNPISQ